MRISIKKPQYIKYPSDYHSVISFINMNLKNHTEEEKKEISMAESLYFNLSFRNLIQNGKICGIKINVVNDQKYLRDMVVKDYYNKKSVL